MKHTAFVALGANLGNPEATLRAALETLAQQTDWALVSHSSLYRTAPVGFADQPDFVNAVAKLSTQLDPVSLLNRLLAIEQQFGRIRRELNGPRTLDLDLLLHDQTQVEMPMLTLPHPRLHLRAFVLIPLAEIAPDLILPGRGPVSAYLPTVAKQSIHRI